MIADRDLNHLDPRYRGLFDVYLGELKRVFVQFDIIVVETLRSKERQLELLAGGEATKTRYSNHLLGKAIDIGFYRHETQSMDWREETYQNVYARLDPCLFGLISGGQLWGWDYGHLELLDSRLVYPTLVGSGEDVWLAQT